MSHEEVISLIQDGIDPTTGSWADIGAGTGAFTKALRDILNNGIVYAFDKNPHMLWRLESRPQVSIEVVEGDFTQSFDLPEKVNGIVMANALHYAENHQLALQNALDNLVPGGTFILVEYNTDRPSPPYVPYPLSEATFRTIADKAGLKDLEVLERKASVYQGEMYVIRGKI